MRTINATNPNIPLTITGLVTSTAALPSDNGNFPGLTVGGVGDVIFDNPIILDSTVVVDSGSMSLAGQATLTASSLTVNSGATLVIDNSSTNIANRVAAAIPITLAGGTLLYKANTQSGAVSTETLGSITLNWRR